MGLAPKRVTKPPYEAVQLANTFVGRYGREQIITHMKLQKLCYFAYGWWLALGDGQRLSASGPQVWKLGPVFQPIYSAFASHRNEPIRDTKKVSPFSSNFTIEPNDGLPNELVDWVWERYGHYSGIQLSDMTHEKGTPWYRVAEKHNFRIPRFQELPDDEIRPYFLELAEKEGLSPLVGQ